MLPPYDGPEVHLFRGGDWIERQEGVYGPSWSDNIRAARKFALGSRYRYWNRLWARGSVLLETTAGPDAIISRIPYDVRGLGKYRREHEYVVDYRLLGPVLIVRRIEPTRTAE